jgi:CHASE3 domain sensor protein
MAEASTAHQRRTELGRSALVRTIALLLILAFATGLFFFAISDRVQEEEDSVTALQALRAEIATAESSVRGYALVGNAQFLEPYRLAVPAVDEGFNDVNAALEEDERARIATVKSIFGEWRRIFAEPTIALMRQGRSEDAETLAETGRGKRRMDQIKVLLADEIAAERRESDSAGRVEIFLGALAIAGIAALCLAVGIAWWGWRAVRNSG